MSVNYTVNNDAHFDHPVDQARHEWQSEPNSTDHLILVVMLCVCSVSGGVSLAGNAMVLCIIGSGRAFRRSVTFNFIANICVSDILISTLVVPFQFQVHLLHRWLIPRFLCYTCPAIQVLLVSNSVFTLTAIAIERYRAVLHPLRARTSGSKAKLDIACIWLLAVVICVPSWFELKVQFESDPMTGKRTLAHCTAATLQATLFSQYNTALVFVHYFIPLCIISFCYTRMAIVLKRTNPEISELDKDSRLYCESARKNKQKVVKMLFIVVFLFLVCWMPIQLVNILKELWPELSRNRYFNVIKFACNWLALSSSCYNPYIYIVYNERFRNEFRRKFRCIYYVFCSMRSDTDKNSNQQKSSNKLSY